MRLWKNLHGKTGSGYSRRMVTNHSQTRNTAIKGMLHSIKDVTTTDLQENPISACWRPVDISIEAPRRVIDPNTSTLRSDAGEIMYVNPLLLRGNTKYVMGRNTTPTGTLEHIRKKSIKRRNTEDLLQEKDPSPPSAFCNCTTQQWARNYCQCNDSGEHAHTHRP